MSAGWVAEEMRRRLAPTLTYRTEDEDAFTAGCADAAGVQDGTFARSDTDSDSGDHESLARAVSPQVNASVRSRPRRSM